MRDRWDAHAVTVRCQGAPGPRNLQSRCTTDVHLTDDTRAAWERGEPIYCAQHVEAIEPRRAA